MNSQEEVTPQKAFPPDTNKTTTLKKIRCHASDVATKKPANEVELMSYLISFFFLLFAVCTPHAEYYILFWRGVRGCLNNVSGCYCRMLKL